MYAKAEGIFIATIAYRMTAGDQCSGDETVLEMLASMASEESPGVPSLDDGGGPLGGGCNTLAKVAGENSDGDYFFCGARPEDLEPLFRTAAGQLTGGTRLIKLPPN
jgi:hypothetical protein